MLKDHSKDSSCSASCQGLMWWATLLVAVLAVPSFGFMVAQSIPLKGVGEVLVFICACWFCTFLGMRLMKNPNMSKKLGSSDKS